MVYPKNSNYLDLLFQDLNSILITTLPFISPTPSLGFIKSKIYYKNLTGFYISFSALAFPIVSYINADTQKESVLNDNKAKAGVYCWTNIESGKKYVGSSIDLYRRFMQYYNIKYITRTAESSLICRALLKYGYSKFKLEILEYCDSSIIIEREQYYIDLLKPEYNILKVAGSLFGFKHSPESLQKMREIALNRSDETKAKLREAALGKTYNHTEETKIKLRDAILGKKHSEETKEKLFNLIE